MENKIEKQEENSAKYLKFHQRTNNIKPTGLNRFRK